MGDKSRYWRYRRTVLTAVCLAHLAVAACASQDPPTLILVALDGFGPGLFQHGVTPTLEALTRDGIRAKALVPVFPTKTFPTFYSIVTGLYPEHHGVVANNMYDPEFDARFSLGNREAVRDGRWYGGQPIWVTAEKQGQRTAPFFWPGSEAEIDGVRPSYWAAFDHDMPPRDRVRRVLEWLDLPREERPTFITLYFSDVDGAAHRHGPDAPEVHAALRSVDSALATLLSGLGARGLRDRVNLMVVSDHGMVATSPERVIVLDDHVSPSDVWLSDWSPVAAIWVPDDRVDTTLQRLEGSHTAWSVYRKADIPERLHYRAHRRIAPIIAVADEGWSISSREYFEADPSRFAGASHGYDNALPSMHGILVAWGPAFRQGVEVGPIGSIHLYALMCRVLGLEPAPNDGSIDSVTVLLR